MRELVDRLPNAGALDDLVRWARLQSTDVAEGILKELLENPNAEKRLSGLQFMQRVGSLRGSVRSQIRVGLARNDPSEIGHWLKSFVGILGMKGLLSELDGVADAHPSTLVHAWYRLFILVSKQSPEFVPELKRLGQKIDAASVAFEPKTLATWRELIEHFRSDPAK